MFEMFAFERKRYFSLLAVLEEVILTTPGAGRNDKFVNIVTFTFEWHVKHRFMYWNNRINMVGCYLNTSRPRQNGRYFADDIFKCSFFNGNIWISIKISLKFVPEVRINDISALVQRMAWHRPGDKPLSQSMMVCLLTHICVTRPQWVK